MSPTSTICGLGVAPAWPILRGLRRPELCEGPLTGDQDPKPNICHSRYVGLLAACQPTMRPDSGQWNKASLSRGVHAGSPDLVFRCVPPHSRVSSIRRVTHIVHMHA
jgi:hypothetical protein